MNELRRKTRIIPGLLYLLLIVYGSLYPFYGWETSHWRLPDWPRHVSRSDAAVNVLVYIPLGFLVTGWVSARFEQAAKLVLVALLGTGLSFALECLQGFLPGRVPSLVDVLLNGIGTLIGVALAFCFRGDTPWGEKLRGLRGEWILPGRLPDVGLGVLALWALSQLAPFVPSLDVGNLKRGARPLWQTVHDLSWFSWPEAAVYSLNLAALGVIAAMLAQEGKRVLPLFWVFAAGTLVMKIPVVGRQLSLEALAGLGTGMLLGIVLLNLPRHGARYAAAIALLMGFVIGALHPDAVAPEVRQFNWVPFRGQMQNIIGFADILEGIWPFAALSFLAMSIHSVRRKELVYAGSVVLFLFAFTMEWLQQTIPGRSPDITDAMIAVGGWSVPLLLVNEHMEKT